jgi:hypothetical protein
MTSEELRDHLRFVLRDPSLLTTETEPWEPTKLWVHCVDGTELVINIETLS